MVLMSPLLALSVYRGNFASFKDAFRYFWSFTDSKNLVEVSQVAVRIDRTPITLLRRFIETYAAQKALVIGSDAAHVRNPKRELLRFDLVGSAFHISIENRYEDDVFMAAFMDNDREDWTVYRDEFVDFFAATFGNANVQVIE